MNPLPPAPDARNSAVEPSHGMPPTAPQAQMPPPPPIINTPPSGFALLKALQRRWRSAAIVAPLVGALVGAAVWFLAPPPTYVARATLILNRTAPNPLLRSSADSDTSLDNFRQLQITLIKSQRILLSVVRDPNLAQLQTLREAENPLAWLEESLSFNSPGNAEVLQVNLQGEYPDDLRALVNAVVKTYLAEFVTSEQDIRNARLSGLRKYKEQYQEEVNRTRSLRREYFAAGASNPNQVALQMAFLQADVQRRQGELGKLESEVAELEAQQKQMQNRDPSRISLDNDIFREFYEQDAELRSLEAQRREAKDNLTDAKLKGFREVVTNRLQEKLDALEKQILGRKNELRPAAERYWKQRSASDFAKHGALIADALDLKRSLVDKYQKDLDRAKLMLENLSKNQIKLDDLTFDNQALIEISKQLDMEYNRLRMAANDPPRARELEEARVFMNQSRYRQLKLAGLGGGVAVFLVLAGLSLWEFHGRRVENVDQVVYGLGLPLVGTVPAMPKQRLFGSVNGDDMLAWRCEMEEAVATARTMLFNAARTADLRLVMITSAMPGEGKTSFSTQLALSMAMAGHRTLMLDFDMRNPSAHKHLDVPHTPGWAEILRGEINAPDAIRPTSIQNLYFIPAGDCDGYALRALAHDQLGQVLKWLRSQYDFVIIDTCPVLPVADALLLGRHVDGVIFSVLNHVSQLPKIYVAMQRVAQLGIRTLGAVVNGVREDKYGYGSYGYGYHKAGRAKQAPDASQDIPSPGVQHTSDANPTRGDA